MRFTMIATYLAIIVTTLVLMSIYIISLLSENLYSTETINMFAKANIISETIADVWGSDTSATSAQKFSDVVERSLAGTNIRGVVTNNRIRFCMTRTKNHSLSARFLCVTF